MSARDLKSLEPMLGLLPLRWLPTTLKWEGSPLHLLLVAARLLYCIMKTFLILIVTQSDHVGRLQAAAPRLHCIAMLGLI